MALCVMLLVHALQKGKLAAVDWLSCRCGSFLQVQYSLLDRRPENGMSAYCSANGISLLPYGTVAGGLLSDQYLSVPASRHGA